MASTFWLKSFKLSNEPILNALKSLNVSFNILKYLNLTRQSIFRKHSIWGMLHACWGLLIRFWFLENIFQILVKDFHLFRPSSNIFCFRLAIMGLVTQKIRTEHCNQSPFFAMKEIYTMFHNFWNSANIFHENISHSEPLTT